MKKITNFRFDLRAIANGLLALGVLVFLFLKVMGADIALEPDSTRYINMGLNLEEYGVLASGYKPGVVPQPGMGQGGALIAVEIALAAALDESTKEILVCLSLSKTLQNDCGSHLPGLQAVYLVEGAIFLLCLWWSAQLIFNNTVISWLAVVAALSCKETFRYTATILSEPMFLTMAGLFLLAWVAAWKRPQHWKYWFVCGALLGLTALAKPAWSPLLAVLLILLAAGKFIVRDTSFPVLRSATALTGGFALVMGAFLIRNVIEMDVWALSDSGYLAASLAHRLGYNHMSWAQWAMGWIYYIPDFGDNLAASLFGKEAVLPLGWGSESYYVLGRDTLYAQAAKATVPGGEQAYLLEQHLFNDVAKNMAVSALLFWRGIFVGNIWGFIAVVAAAPVFYFLKRDQRIFLGLLLCPPIIMAGVHAMVSVSIHRYNIALIPGYSILIAATLYGLGVGIVSLVPDVLLAKAKTFLPKKG